MTQERIVLTKKDRLAVTNRHQMLQSSWNYERMQNGGWCYSMIPAIKRLYPNKEDQVEALKRHLEFYNTQPFCSAPVMGVTLALEEERANGAPVEDATIQGVKVGMMGPLAGVGDPVFWFTVRPILGALGASLAMDGSIIGPILFFVVWNAIRYGFIYYTLEMGYKLGTTITQDLSGGILGKITTGASVLGMFIIGGLVQRWVSISLSSEIYTNADAGTTLQSQIDSLTPGLLGLLCTLVCLWLLRKKVSPIVIILALFAVGIAGTAVGLF